VDAIQHYLQRSLSSHLRPSDRGTKDTSAAAASVSDTECCSILQVIPAAVRKWIIEDWVTKLQEFWSLRRCAYLKSITLTSNSCWSWFRALLGREIKEGKWVDKVIDGNFNIHVTIHIQEYAYAVELHTF